MVSAEIRGEVGGRPLVALGGGRVVDAAKAIGGADGLPVAAIPTTLSGAEMTRFHRMPAGFDGWQLTRPTVVVADPDLMASAPMPGLAASAMNALAHAMEALYTPLANPVATGAGLRAAQELAGGLADDDPTVRALLSARCWPGTRPARPGSPSTTSSVRRSCACAARRTRRRTP